MSTDISWGDMEGINKLLVGHSVVKAEGDTLTLDNGKELVLVPNDGGCACSAGVYELDRLNVFSNIITSADVIVESRDEWDEAKTYHLFVYSEGIGESIADISGDDGSGYYGTGFHIYAKESK